VNGLVVSFRNQSSKLPERGQPGAAVWLWTVTTSFVKWNAGKRTTGVRVPGFAGFVGFAAPPSSIGGLYSRRGPGF
jgi:hypothetical protein